MTAHNWRTMRLRLLEKGIATPMGLPSMHVVFDATEKLMLESATAEAKSSQEAEQAISEVYDRLYTPDLTDELSRMNGATDEELMRPPPGFEDDEIEASFDAFLSRGA